MIKIDSVYTFGIKMAIHGMRNSYNSWDSSDSDYCACFEECVNCPNNLKYGETCIFDDKDFIIGPKDLKLMQKLIEAGPEHSKFMRMIHAQFNVTAPLYWWKEFDTYKVGTVANSCSTMHTIMNKKFELDDFSHDNLVEKSIEYLSKLIDYFNDIREKYMETNDKLYWHQIIQLLPSSYNQKRTIDLNYEVLKKIYSQRRNHRLNEWHDFCKYIKFFDYAEELICL